MKSLINKSAVKAVTLETLAAARPHLAEKMTRISGKYYEDVNRLVLEIIRDKIANLQSVGKTIK